MKWKLYIVPALAMAFLTPGLFLLSRVGAQDLPGFPLIYSGSVTAAGEPVPDGLKITARMDGAEFGPVLTANGRYLGLTVNGVREDMGKTISFYLWGVAKADQEDAFIYQSSPRVPAVKVLDLTFPFLPQATPTPTATPTVTPSPTATPTPSPLGPLPVGLQAPGGDPYHLGDEFTVDVRIAPEGHRILRGEVAVAFDPRYVKPLSSAVGPLLPQAVQASTIGETLVQVVFFQVETTPPLREAGPLAVFRFKVRNDATAVSTEITLLKATIVDHRNQPLELALHDLSLTLSLEGIPGDINRDERVNIVDLALLGAAHGSKVGETPYDPNADLNEDGEVGPQDVRILSTHYGEGT